MLGRFTLGSGLGGMDTSTTSTVMRRTTRRKVRHMRMRWAAVAIDAPGRT
jgi:hypothetical protein